MAGLKYDKVTIYKISARSASPLHIGSSLGDKEEVLIDAVDKKPFIQASSIAGVCKTFLLERYAKNDVEYLFGQSDVSNMSRLVFEDGRFTGRVKLELRPHVSINRATGSVDAKTANGTSSKSGQKFNMEYVAADTPFEYSMFLYEDSSNETNIKSYVDELLAGLKSEEIVFGGKKSSGSGHISLDRVETMSFDLKKDEDRKKWINISFSDNNYTDQEIEYSDITNQISNMIESRYAYRIKVEGETENYIQIKGFATSGNGENAPDSESIRNANNDFIIPGSSVRGSIRSQMEKIAKYIGCTNLIEKSFGSIESKDKKAIIGNLVFSDVIIGNQEENLKMPIENRIHIDKFTGSVFDKGKFNERNVAGSVEIGIDIIDNEFSNSTLALLIYALRDLAMGTMSFGNGYNIGKGFINISKISIVNKFGEECAKIDFLSNDNSVIDSKGMLSGAFKMLKEACNG